MNKQRILWLWFFLANVLLAHGQSIYFGGEHLVFYSDTLAPASVYMADLDSDADMDILFALDSQIIWHENLGSHELFGKQQIITIMEQATEPLQVYAADLDNDGDQDILSTSGHHGQLLWMENTDGQANFGTKQVIHSTANQLESVFVADLDGDGDQDILTASMELNALSWHENTNGHASFGPRRSISDSVKAPSVVYAADLDGDGDQDVLSASADSNEIVWLENTGGDGLFGNPQVITTAVVDVESLLPADLDGDGDPDLLSASSWDNKVAWYQNVDGKGTFGRQNLIATYTTDAMDLYATDLDQDGDQDVLTASFWDNRIAWYENTNGGGVFGARQTITTSADRPGFVYASDLDGDGDRDVVSVSTDFKIAWFENTLPLKLIENPQNKVVTPGSNTSLQVVAESAETYQWQVDTGTGFWNLMDHPYYSGTDSSVLEIDTAVFNMSGNAYRCVVSRQSDSLVSDKASLIVEDRIKPVILSHPDDQSVPVDDDCRFILPDYTDDVEATDNYAGSLSIEQSPAPGKVVTERNIQVTLTVTDFFNNRTARAFMVEAADTIAPVIKSTHPDDTLEPFRRCQAVLHRYTHTVMATDNCQKKEALKVYQSPEPYAYVSDSVSEVTLTVADDYGSRSEVAFHVYIVDTEAPRLSCPEDQIVEPADEQSSYTVSGESFDVLSADDNCEIRDLSNNINASSTLEGARFSLDTTRVIWTATDKAGNEAQCSFNVFVRKLSSLHSLYENGISVYPNPTEGTLNYESKEHVIHRLKVMDVTGKILWQQADLGYQGTVDLSWFSAGIYYLNLVTEEKSMTFKILLE